MRGRQEEAKSFVGYDDVARPAPRSPRGHAAARARHRSGARERPARRRGPSPNLRASPSTETSTVSTSRTPGGSRAASDKSFPSDALAWRKGGRPLGPDGRSNSRNCASTDDDGSLGAVARLRRQSFSRCRVSRSARAVRRDPPIAAWAAASVSVRRDDAWSCELTSAANEASRASSAAPLAAAKARAASRSASSASRRPFSISASARAFSLSRSRRSSSAIASARLRCSAAALGNWSARLRLSTAAAARRPSSAAVLLRSSFQFGDRLLGLAASLPRGLHQLFHVSLEIFGPRCRDGDARTQATGLGVEFGCVRLSRAPGGRSPVALNKGVVNGDLGGVDRRLKIALVRCESLAFRSQVEKFDDRDQRSRF